MKNNKKYFVLDTNILLQSPNAIFGFADNVVVITSTVLQELDSKKNIVGEIGYNARETIRTIEELREKNSCLTSGVPLGENGTFLVYVNNNHNLPREYSMERADNRIIADCLALTLDKVGHQVILVTNDISMRINASVLGVPVEGYKNEQVTSADSYTGRLEFMDKSIRSNEEIELPKLIPNQYIQFADALAVENNGELEILGENSWKTDYCTPRNAGQRFALHALLSDIPLVILKGPAGCVDGETEFFNGYEWKKIKEWTNKDKVLQIDSETGISSLVTPNAYIKIPCDDMYHIKTKYGIDQVLSEDHRVIYYNKAKRHKGYNGPYEILTNELVEKQNTKGNFYGKIKTDFYYDGKGINLSDNEIKIMCLTICEGTFNKNHINSKRCVVKVKKDRKVQQIKKLLDEAQIKYTESKKNNGYTIFSYMAPRREKEFSEFWYDSNNKQLQIICNNILQWDGYVTANRSSFTTANKKTADFIQFAFSACGYRATINVSKFKGEAKIMQTKTKKKTYYRQNDLYQIIITKRSMVGLTTDNRPTHKKTFIEKVKSSDGFKYCFNVPTHALVLRYNNHIFITGNSAKTFLSMAAAFNQYYSDKCKYEKIMITRTNTLSDADLGYLPGDLEDKMMPLIMPFIDNAQTLLSINNGYGHKDGINEAKMQVEEMIDSGALEICSMAYMRGRSLNNAFIIIDEAQNATRGQILEIVTRAGKGTKVVICGDPDQIDNPKLDKHNNGLAFASERMKGSPLCAQITFKQSETVRSDLASDAAERLKV